MTQGRHPSSRPHLARHIDVPGQSSLDELHLVHRGVDEHAGLGLGLLAAGGHAAPVVVLQKVPSEGS